MTTDMFHPSQPVFALSSYCCGLSDEATNTNVIVFGLTKPGLKQTIYRTRGEHGNHYATDAVKKTVRSDDFNFYEVDHFDQTVKICSTMKIHGSMVYCIGFEHEPHVGCH
jgi:hypothetical protein